MTQETVRVQRKVLVTHSRIMTSFTIAQIIFFTQFLQLKKNQNAKVLITNSVQRNKLPISQYTGEMVIPLGVRILTPKPEKKLLYGVIQKIMYFVQLLGMVTKEECIRFPFNIVEPEESLRTSMSIATINSIVSQKQLLENKTLTFTEI